MRRFALSSGLILGSLIASAAVRSDELSDRSMDCGSSALYLVLKQQGCEFDYGALLGALPSRHETGYSMSELRSAAKTFGVDMEGVQLSIDHMPLKDATVAYFDGAEGHFVCLKPVGTLGRMVQVLDPPHVPRIIDYEQLFANAGWTGKALVVRSTRDRLQALTLAISALIVVAILILICRRNVRVSASLGARPLRGFRLR